MSRYSVGVPFRLGSVQVLKAGAFISGWFGGAIVLSGALYVRRAGAVPQAAIDAAEATPEPGPHAERAKSRMLPQLETARFGEVSAGCLRGVQAACVDLGRYYEEGNGVRVDAERARALYQNACDAGQQRGCAHLGLAQLELPNADEKAIRRLFDRSCRTGEMLGCQAHAEVMLDGVAGPKDAKGGRALLDRACQRRPEACARLALVYENGEGVPKDPSRALTLNVRACTDGAAMGCTNAGHLYYFGSGVDSDRMRAAEFAEKACKLGSQTGCVNFGRAIFGGDGMLADRERAVQFFKPACEMGNVLGCQALGYWYVQVRRDAKSAAPAFAFACEREDFESCSNLGHMILSGDLLTKDRRAAALPYLQRACDGKFGLGCRNLAVLWQRFGSPQKAEEFYERGCDLADAEACEQAGWYWCEGKLAKADDALAVRYLARACEGGRPWACGHLGIFFEWGQSVPLDPERSTQLYEGGCKQNEPESCLWLGILFRSGHGVPVDAKRGTAAIQRSCQLGNQEGCGELGVSYLDGLGVAPDPDKGLALLRHSCLAQVGTSCLQLGFAYETGRHVVQNPMLARELYTKGCNAKPSIAESCTRLANLKASAPQKPVVRAPASVTAGPR